MKYLHLERYKITLETVSPIFIGSMDNYAKKELVYIPNEGIVLIPDLGKLISLLEDKGCLERFERFLLDNVNNKTLRDFLQEQSVQLSVNAPWVKYHLRCSSNDMGNLNTLSAFIKNAEGKPYIPGTSIKGAIRTALLADMGTEGTFNSVKDTAMHNFKERRAGAEEHVLRVLKVNTERNKEKDAVNDLLKSLQVSDSAPFELDSLIICKKLELTKDGMVNGISSGFRRGRASAPLFRECLRPGLKTQFYLTIDKSVAGNQLTIQMIISALKKWMTVQDEYADCFDQLDVALKGMQARNVPIILGGGVGFQSKSLLMKLKQGRDDTIHYVLKNQFYKTYKNAPDDPAPYRMKLAQYNGSFYPMGRCSMTVEE